MSRYGRVVLALALVVAVFGLLAAPAGAAVTIQRLGFCGGDDWEPDIAADNTGHVYVLITHFAGNTTCDPASGANGHRIMIQVSNDGGKTFGSPRLVSDTPGGVNYPAQADPAIAVDQSTGAVYVAFLAFGISGGHTNIFVAKSTDQGATFPQVAQANSKDCKNCDHEKILASGNNVYVAYSQAASHFLSLSTNGGATFTQSTILSADIVAFAEGGTLDAAGNAWFGWGDCQTSNCTGSPATDYRVSETLAGTSNTTFSPVLAQAPQGPDCPFASCGFAYFGGQDDIAIDGAGTIYLAWQDGQVHTARKSPTIINLSSCSQNCTSGANWKLVGRVDDKTASGCAASACFALFPKLTGGSAAGQISATWMDDRNGSPVDHTNGWNVWYRTSTTGGASWTAAGQRISQFDPSQSQSQPNGFLFPYGDYMALQLNPNCPTRQPILAWGEGHNWVGGPTNPGHIEYSSLC